jgi:hypothetical protein
MRTRLKVYRSGIVIITLLLLAVGCSPTQRLNRLIKRNPYLLELKDTITIRDSVRIHIPGVKTDTVISILQARDTFYFHKEFVHVKTYIRGDSIYIEAKTDPIDKVVYREIKVPVEKIVYRKPRDKLMWASIIPLALLALVFAVAYFRKPKNTKEP